MSRSALCSIKTYGGLTRPLTTNETKAQTKLLGELREAFTKSRLFSNPDLVLVVSSLANAITGLAIKKQYGCIPPEFLDLLNAPNHLLLKRSPPGAIKNTAFSLLWLVALFISFWLISYAQAYAEEAMAANQRAQLMTFYGAINQMGEMLANVTGNPGPATLHRNFIHNAITYSANTGRTAVAFKVVHVVNNNLTLSGIASAIMDAVPKTKTAANAIMPAAEVKEITQ